MLDCHIIISADTPSKWVAQCLDSVQAAIDCAGFPVELHVVDGVPGHIGKARAAGYARGVHPYVTCVDDDDYVLSNAFADLADTLAQRPDAIFPAELTEQNGRRRPGMQQHHLAVYRRDVLIDHTQWPCCGDVAQITATDDLHVVNVPASGYVHRLYDTSKARALRRANPNELERARG